MSDELVKLVLGLEPPVRGSYHLKGATHARDRHLLLTLAAIADDNGTATASLTELQALTLYHVSVLHGARASLAAQNYVDRQSGTSVYQINVQTLRDKQSGAELRLRVPLYNLTDYGLPSAIIHRLVQHQGVTTIEGLDRLLAQWRNNPNHEETPENLAHYLDINMLGTGKCSKIIDAIAAWNDTKDQ